MGFASGVFIGPLLVTGIMNAMQKGPTHIVTFIVLFSATQTFGGLVGSSFYSTYQQMRTQEYRAEIIRQLPETNPLIAQRLQSYQQSSHSYTLDQSLEQQQALKTLNQVVTREAQVRAYNDVITLNGVIALLLLLWGAFLIARNQYQLRQQAKLPNS